MNPQPLYSIVIPAHNAAHTIYHTLLALLNQTIPWDQFEIIVVDDGSTDDILSVIEEILATSQTISYPEPAAPAQATLSSPPASTHPSRTPRRINLKLISQPHAGRASARNTGAQAARAPIVLFLDADCVPASNWLEQMIAPFANTKIAGVSGRVDTLQRGLLPRFIQLEYDYRYQRINQHPYIDFVSSATAAYRRQVFHQIGGFDSALLGAEDAELSFRLSEMGYKLVFAPRAVVYHVHPESLKTYLQRKFTYAFWRTAAYSRHPQKMAHDSRTPQTQKIQILLTPLILSCTLMGIPWPSLLPIAGLLTLLFLATTSQLTWRARKIAPSVALVTPPLLLASAAAAAAGLAAGLLWNKTHHFKRKSSP